MNILYLANPASIHDIRWINHFAIKREVNCFIVVRKLHAKAFAATKCSLAPRASVIDFIDDPSTVRFWRNSLVAFRILKWVNKYNIDAIHILYAEPNALWTEWKWLFRVPIIITTRGTDILRTIPAFFDRPGILNRLVARRYRRALGRADRITCTSLRQIESLRQLGILSMSMILVRTGVDFNLLSAVKGNVAGSYGIHKPFVLMPRNMSRVYNHELTIEAIGLLSDQILKNYAFVFIHNDTADHKYYELIRTKAAMITADIRFLPALRHEQLLALFQESTLVVMNPLSDGSTVSAMEAMASRVPVILPPLPYDSDVFENAWIFSEWSAACLSDKITEVLNQPDKGISDQKEKNWLAVYEYGNTDTELAKIYNLYVELFAPERPLLNLK